MIEWLTAAVLLLGASFLFIAALGLWRLPDLYMRMSASIKAVILGISLIMLGAVFAFDELAERSRGVLIIAFFAFTSPVGAHLLGRAGYMSGAPLWKGTQSDALRDDGFREKTGDRDEGSERKMPPDGHG